jgi:hypothetical protein
MKPATFLIASASKITPGWATDGIASNATVTPITPSSPIFIGFEYDINEAVWGAIELDWKKMNNRCSTSIGRNIWVASGYDANLVGYMFVVEKPDPAVARCMKLFPILTGPNKMTRDQAFVPWAAIEQHLDQALHNHGGQSLERLASRGGLSATEAAAVLEDREWCKMSDDAAWAAIYNALNKVQA